MPREAEPVPLWEQGRTKASLSLSTKTISGSMELLTSGPTPFLFRGPGPGERQEDLLAHHPAGYQGFLFQRKGVADFYTSAKENAEHPGCQLPAPLFLPFVASVAETPLAQGIPALASLLRRGVFCEPRSPQRKTGEQKTSLVWVD